MEHITNTYNPPVISELPVNLTAHNQAANEQNVSRFSQQYLRYQLQQLGWQGQLGASLILASLLFLFLVALPKAQLLQTLQMKHAEQKLNATHQVNAQAAHTEFNVEQQFYVLLPHKSQANSKISTLLQAASASGLTTDKVDYTQLTLASAIVQYHINLPAQGSYKQIRQFINQALNALPSLALDEVSLRREDVASETLDAQIQFTLYVQNDPLAEKNVED